MELVNPVIYEELCLGKGSEVSGKEYIRMIHSHARRAALESMKDSAL